MAISTHRPRLLLIIGIVLLVVFGIFAALVAADPTHPFTQGLDDAWRRFIGGKPGDENGVLQTIFQELGQIGGAVVFALLLPIFLLLIRRWRSALFVLSGFMGTALLSQLVKNLVNRPRPAEDLADGLYGPLVRVDHGSLPSGHAVTTGCVVIIVAALLPIAARRIWWIFGALLAVGIIWQRTLINAHWLSDTVAGLILGIGATLIIWWAFAPLLEADRARKGRRRASAPTKQSAV